MTKFKIGDWVVCPNEDGLSLGVIVHIFDAREKFNFSLNMCQTLSPTGTLTWKGDPITVSDPEVYSISLYASSVGGMITPFSWAASSFDQVGRPAEQLDFALYGLTLMEIKHLAMFAVERKKTEPWGHDV